MSSRRQPLHERAWRYRDYAGSIIKPIGALAFLEAGSVTPDETIRCERFFEHNGRKLLDYFKCHTAHGPLDLETALYKSCNIYFQTAIPRPDAFKRFVEMGRRLGLGQNTGLELEAQKQAWGEWPSSREPGPRRRTRGRVARRGDPACLSPGRPPAEGVPLGGAVARRVHDHGGQVAEVGFQGRNLSQEVLHRDL